MAVKNPFRLVGADGTDPQLEEDKAIIKRILADVSEKVDTEGIESLVVIGIAHNGDVISGRHMHKNYYAALGAMDRARHEINGLMDSVNIYGSEQEY